MRAWVAIAPGVVGAVVFGSRLHQVWGWTPDDAYITFRYSSMLAQGHGPTYDIGFPHAEGYTSFAWMAILSAPSRLGLDVPAVAKISGVVAMVIAVAVAALFVGRRTASPVGAGLVVLACGIAAPSAIHAVAGMETALDTLVLTALFAAAAGRRPWLIATVALAAGLTRPENNLVVVVLFAGLVLAHSDRPRLVRSFGLAYVLPGALYMGWRIAYYRQPLPLPFYAKVANAPLLAGAADTHSYVFAVLLVLAIPAALACNWHPALRAPALAALTVPLFFVLPAHITGYDWRFLWPITPFMVAIATIGLSEIPSHLTFSGRWPVSVIAALTVVLRFGTVDTSGVATAVHARDANAARVTLARQLRSVGSGTVVLEDAGVVPYVSGWTAIDTFSLNDAHIATSGDHSPQYVMAHHPDLIVVPIYGASSPIPSTVEPGFEQAALNSGMVNVGEVTITPADHWELFVWPRSPTARALRSYS